MSEIPSLSYIEVIKALQRGGFIIVRQKGSHIRLQKRMKEKTIKITVPAHKPIKKSTLAKIIKEAGLTVEEFKELL
jgi:predicted RNA binding protein YcfA (HicA-like mRNA interferase family)